MPLLTAAVRILAPVPLARNPWTSVNEQRGPSMPQLAAVGGELNSVPVRPQKPDEVASMYADHRFGPLLWAGLQVSEEKFVVVPPLGI